MDQLLFVPQRQMLKLQSDLEALATACRVNCLSMVAKAGVGHLGGSLSSIDIMVWLYHREMQDGDIFILSKGHAVLAQYSVLHSLGRLSDNDILTFRDGKGGLPAHPAIGTPGIVCNTGSLGMGISKAKGMIFADRLQGIKRRYFVLIGDGELQEGQVWESLQLHGDPVGQIAELLPIVDRNHLQGQGSTASTRYIAGLAQVLRCHCRDTDGGSGHDMANLARAFSEAACYSYALIFNTLKGKGVSFMENNPAWHSRPLTQQEYEIALKELMDRLGTMETFSVPHTWPEPMQPEPLVAAYGQALLEAAERYPSLVVLDADLAKEHGLLTFKERYPDRFFEIGIAEQDMVGIASGMALNGLLPVVHSHAAFLTRRALDQVHNQMTERTAVVYTGGSAGKLQPNGNGKSHETLIDGITMALLGMPVYEPHSPEDVAGCLARCLEGRGSSYLRLLKLPPAKEGHHADATR